mgnify:CR=1 FL=1
MENNQAKVSIQLDRVLAKVDPLIFGHFTEHAFGNIYGGMYDPGSSKADEDGFRTDIIEAMRRMKEALAKLV